MHDNSTVPQQKQQHHHFAKYSVARLLSLPALPRLHIRMGAQQP
jgi:hypothetical protein